MRPKRQQSKSVGATGKAVLGGKTQHYRAISKKQEKTQINFTNFTLKEFEKETTNKAQSE